MRNNITKQQLDEIYSRYELFPFERLNALLTSVRQQLDSIADNASLSKAGSAPDKDRMMPRAAKSLSVILIFLLLSFTSCKKEDVDICANTTCLNGGFCNSNDGLCACPFGYEGADCGTEMRSKFIAVFHGFINDGQGWSEQYDIEFYASSAGVDKLYFLVDGEIPVQVNVVNSTNISIPGQTAYDSFGDAYYFLGSGVIVNRELSMDYIMNFDGNNLSWHFNGVK